ncbi:MAG: fibrobacter succinogenes major paralogous domain-containing protein [Bacteroidales bacterium]
MKVIFGFFLILMVNFIFAQNSKSIMTDSRDGQEYEIVKIGNQVWMAENLNYRTSNGSYCYDNKLFNCDKYGRLYKWEVALKACPRGWQLPSKNDWEELIDYVWGSRGDGFALKSEEGWKNNGDGADQYGFSALPAGRYARFFLGEKSPLSFDFVGEYTDWWTGSEYNSGNSWVYSMTYDLDDVFNYFLNKDHAYSVRCVKDKE